jgi:MFS family permease
MLIAARSVQGVGGAVVSAVALSLVMTLFADPTERAKATGIFGFVASGGGSLRPPSISASEARRERAQRRPRPPHLQAQARRG